MNNDGTFVTLLLRSRGFRFDKDRNYDNMLRRVSLQSTSTWLRTCWSLVFPRWLTVKRCRIPSSSKTHQIDSPRPFRTSWKSHSTATPSCACSVKSVECCLLFRFYVSFDVFLFEDSVESCRLLFSYSNHAAHVVDDDNSTSSPHSSCSCHFSFDSFLLPSTQPDLPRAGSGATVAAMVKRSTRDSLSVWLFVTRHASCFGSHNGISSNVSFSHEINKRTNDRSNVLFFRGDASFLLFFSPLP